MPEHAYRNNLLGNMVLKLKLNPDQHVSEATINGNLIPAYFEEEGFAFLYLPPLHRKKYQLQYCTGNGFMPLHVFNDGTYNVYGLTRSDDHTLVTLKMYGRQTVKIQCNKPEGVVSQTDGLVVENFDYLADTSRLLITVKAANMQGTSGEIRLQY